MVVDERTNADRGADAGKRSRAHGSSRARRVLWPVIGIIVWLLVGGPLASLAGKTTEVQQNDNASFLPGTAESTEVLNINKRFVTQEVSPAIIVYERHSGLTEADRAKIVADLGAMTEHLGALVVGAPIGPVYSEDGKAAQVIVNFAGSDVRKAGDSVAWMRELISASPGLAGHVTGPVGIFSDFTVAFDGINGILLLVTLVVILVILVAVYRSPTLPLLVLMVAGFALSVANGIVYLLAKADILTLTGQTQGILDVLVLGAGTDYALLIVSRFREELRRHESKYDAMKVAWRASLEPIIASGGTVILGLLCLLVSDLASNRGLGPVGAVGIACAMAAMLVFLPAVLVLLGRRAFWPRRPDFGSAPAEESGLWARVAATVGRRARLVWALTTMLLLVAVLGLFRLQADGIPQTESFSTQVDSKVGQAVIADHFPAGTGSPAQIIVKAESLSAVMAAASAVPGVASVVAYTGLPAARPGGENVGGAGPGGAGPGGAGPGAPKVVDGLIRIDATLTEAADSSKAGAIVTALREAVRAVPGAEAKVGGFSAINFDVQHASQRDRKVIIPLVLAVVFVILALLLRSLVAPLLLVITVFLSFFATLGVSGVFFRDVFHFAGADSSFPLFAFVFLVALGVDYNIFLMTRVREETARRGHRAGTLTGLAVTGGVITSAGVVLAATFAALAVLPLVFLVEMAFAVAFGVLLDTLVVRSLLVPALTIDVGRRIWWPGALRRAKE